MFLLCVNASCVVSQQRSNKSKTASLRCDPNQISFLHPPPNSFYLHELRVKNRVISFPPLTLFVRKELEEEALMALLKTSDLTHLRLKTEHADEVYN